jgi:hypothetical protein
MGRLQNAEKEKDNQETQSVGRLSGAKNIPTPQEPSFLQQVKAGGTQEVKETLSGISNPQYAQSFPELLKQTLVDPAVGVAKSYKDLILHPIESVKNRPIETALNLLPFIPALKGFRGTKAATGTKAAKIPKVTSVVDDAAKVATKKPAKIPLGVEGSQGPKSMKVPLPDEGIKASKPKVPKAPVKEPPPPAIIETPIKQSGPVRTFWNALTENVRDKVRRQGPAGEQLYNKGVAVTNEGIANKGLKSVEIEQNMPKLNPQQQRQFFDAAEGRIPAVDPEVIRAVEYNRRLATEFQQTANSAGVLVDDVTKAPIGNPQTYYPHTLNDVGKTALAKKPNDFFKKLAESNGVTEPQARTMWFRELGPERTVKAGFERPREFNLPAEYIELNPTKAWSTYNSQFHHRVATAKHFGPNYEIAEDLAGKIAQAGGDEFAARNYIDQVTGRSMKNMTEEGAINNLIKRQVHSKLSATAALPNSQQGYLAATNMYGNRYAAYGMLKSMTKEGKLWAKETGTAGKGFYSEFDTTNKAWGRVSGFPLTEDFNFKIVANSSRKFYDDMYKRVQQNPSDSLAVQKLDAAGINWKEALLKGETKLSKPELAKAAVNDSVNSIFPKVPGTTPQWAQSGIGRATYLFYHYQLQNPKFLASEFKFGKKRGLSQLAKTTATATILGEPIADLLAFVRGDERPDNILMRLADNYATVVGGVPLEFVKSSAKYGGFKTSVPSLGGSVLSAPVQSASKITSDVMKGRPDKALEDLVRAFIRGDVPVGPIIPSGALLERSIPRITK